MKKDTNDLLVVPTNVNQLIQIGEVIEIITPSLRLKIKKEVKK